MNHPNDIVAAAYRNLQAASNRHAAACDRLSFDDDDSVAENNAAVDAWKAAKIAYVEAWSDAANKGFKYHGYPRPW